MTTVNHVELTRKKLHNALAKVKSHDAESIAAKYNQVFSEDYLVDYTVEDILQDINCIEQLNSDNQYAVSISATSEDAAKYSMWRIKLFRFNDRVSLSRGLPIIENFGFRLIDEHPFTVSFNDGNTVHICDFGVEVPNALFTKVSDTNLISKLSSAIVAVFNNQVESDLLNSLVLQSGLDIHEVALIRALCHYLVQTSLPFSRQYIVSSLSSYPQIIADLFALFAARFDIKAVDLKLAENINAKILMDLNAVSSLDDDRILKAMLAVINAMLRTNYYQKTADGVRKEYISFKLESAKLSFLPRPLPLYEIFVYSIRFEAIHLRGGKVARGGLRWSDRREDFRTEVLGLVKAQVVKNVVIVPTGSKGGFVCKQLPAIGEREAYLAEGVSCYKTFIAGLLDITDNLVNAKVVSPKDVIRYDDDDPYLVVAADKGTATFSDHANEMSQKYGFWLGDAFASGGSVGYDHKQLGITAKGAWESAKRHFRHLNVNIQTTDFTVIGIGDMAGDVFGNGMLLSEHIRLLAAFNHQHIFLDPQADAATSFLERKRLFNAPRGGWGEYDKTKLGKGGGIFERSVKSIPLSTEVQQWLGVTAKELSPNELIHCILQARADMLYNGGIGTYIKAQSETHENVKDKANEQLRVNGCELQVKVVVEGGNLGVTQLGRIEFAKCGGFICTDAIDNSAGVDCSDHEVNIKILFASVMERGNLSIDARNKILAEMTADVSSLVLRDNYLQTQILAYAHKRASELFLLDVNFMETLEKQGILDRVVEFLPTNEEISERNKAGAGFTMPELSVLLAYSKLNLDRAILHSSVVNESAFEPLLFAYFPKQLQQNYAEYIKTHYLRKEIIATSMANLIVNRMGITFITRFQDEFRCDISQIICAFWAVYQLLDAERIFHAIEALDNKVPADIQVYMLIRMKKALERSARWLMHRVKDGAQMLATISTYGKDVKDLIAWLPHAIHSKDYVQVAEAETKLSAADVPADLVAFIARSTIMQQLLDIAILARESGRKAEVIAANYFQIADILRIDWLRQNLIALPESNKWQALSRSALLADGHTLYSNLMRNAIGASDSTDEHFVVSWRKRESLKIEKIHSMFDELQSYKTLDLAMLSAALRELGSILGAV